MSLVIFAGAIIAGLVVIAIAAWVVLALSDPDNEADPSMDIWPDKERGHEFRHEDEQ
jgi:hypothetical protein